MSVALIVTIFVSLTLVGMGLLLNAQADKAEQFWGDKLQITVFMCNQNSKAANCAEVTSRPAQKTAIKDVIDGHPEVASYYDQTKEEAFDTWKRVYIAKDKSEQEIYSTVKASDMQESYWVKLKDPNKFKGVEGQLASLDGVAAVRDLRQVLKPIYFWMKVMKWGAIAVAAFLLIAAILQVAQHDPDGGVRPAQGDRHHAAGRCLQPLHLAAVPDGDAGRRADRHRPVCADAAGVHVRS